ncbi:hypothetical protein ACFW04_002604 [Cataglyphis niger]
MTRTDNNYEWAIKLNRPCLRILGIWPKNDETKWEKLMINVRVIVLLNIGFWFCIVPSVHSLLRIWGNIMSMVDNLEYTLPSIMAMIKLFIMWKKKKDLLPLLNMIKHDWLKPKTMQERNIMIKRTRLACMITMFGYFIMFISGFFVVILPFFGISVRYLTNITDPDRLVPLQTYYFYDRDKSPFYEITYALQIIGIYMIATSYTGTDCFLSLLVFHVCGQLENLKTRIMITQRGDISVIRLIFMLTVFVNTFVHTCLYCTVGEILVAQCEGVYKAVYECKWYTLEPKKARNLLIIMISANKPIYLTAGKLFPMTMATFCNLLKTSGGYISVLLAYRE